MFYAEEEVVQMCESGGMTMEDLIKRAVKVRDSLQGCFIKTLCRDCSYHDNGCVGILMLDAVNVIERLIKEVEDERKLEE